MEDPLNKMCAELASLTKHMERQETLAALVPELVDCLSEAIDLTEDTREGNYTPDTCTTQPWRTILAKAQRTLMESE